MEGLESKTNNSGHPINREMEEGCYVATVTLACPKLFPDALQMPISPVAQSREPGGRAMCGGCFSGRLWQLYLMP